MRYLILIVCLGLAGCGNEIYVPAEPLAADCEDMGVCTELSPLLYDLPEGQEFVLTDGKVDTANISLLRFIESHGDESSKYRSSITWTDSRVIDSSGESFNLTRTVITLDFDELRTFKEPK